MQHGGLGRDQYLEEEKYRLKTRIELRYQNNVYTRKSTYFQQ